MTDLEFQVMDELYFVSDYEQLQENCELSENDLIITLKSLYGKGWIRIMTSMDIDEEKKLVDLDNKFRQYLYLASKSGLFAHNSTI